MKRIAVLLLLAAALAACGEGVSDAERDAATAEVMSAVVDPNAWTIWDASGVIITAEGEHQRHPTTEEGWAQVQAAAQALQESSDLLMDPTVARESESWAVYVRGMSEQARLAGEAAAAHDPEALFDIGGSLYRVCSGCHQQFSPQILAR